MKWTQENGQIMTQFGSDFVYVIQISSLFKNKNKHRESSQPIGLDYSR